jgi:hypothetical protein
MTEPTVAPRPQWTSGMTAMRRTNGSAAMAATCSCAESSTGTPFVQACTLPSFEMTWSAGCPMPGLTAKQNPGPREEDRGWK